MIVNFQINPEIEIECLWSMTGLEVYRVNGEEIFRTRNFNLKLLRTLDIQVGGQLKKLMFKSEFSADFRTLFSSSGYIIKAYLDDELLIDNLLQKQYVTKPNITLLELMIVVAIIGILAATAMPATHVSYAAKSTVRESIHSVNALQQEIESYFLQHQVFPAHNRDISAKILADLKLRNVKDLSISTGGRIVITYVSRLNFSYPNYYTLDSTDKTLVLKPTFDKHVFVWDYCSEGSVPAEFRGKPCFI